MKYDIPGGGDPKPNQIESFKSKSSDTRTKLLEPLVREARRINAKVATLSMELEGIDDYYFEIKAIRGRMK